MTFKTKGIVLRTVKYGETSIITSVYTELFGMQNYIVKGVRQASKKSGGKAIYFQPSAMLDMVVYHNDLKNLNFIKEYQWGYLYEHVLTDVVKNAVAMFVVEMLHHCLKQPEANPELFYLAKDTFKQLDRGNASLTANLPLYFTLHLGGELGFRIQGAYQADTSVLDLQEGQYISERPNHPYYLDGIQAQITSQLLAINFYSDLENFTLNRNSRRELLQAYQQYIALHVPDFGALKSLKVLEEILS